MPIKADKSLRAYYNEIDPYAAQWLRNLMAEGWITKGYVDERSIEDVRPDDLAGYDRLHFFAGVAIWDYALNQAGWGRGEVWTGSCPCQPFSQAGEGSGFDDERHLWPHFHWLIQQRRPTAIFGEQVASKDADPWIDLVQDDLEALGYAFGTVPFPSASVGAPHIRDRLYWVAHASSTRLEGRQRSGKRVDAQLPTAKRSGEIGGMANTDKHGCNPITESGIQHDKHHSEPCGGAGGLADTELQQRPNWQPGIRDEYETQRRLKGAAAPTGFCGDNRPGPTNGFWRDADWLGCRDGKWRPVEPGTFPLAHGAAARVGHLRGYGNGINAIQAQVFIEESGLIA